MSARSSAVRYGSLAITLHWVTAALIVVLFATGLLATSQSDDAARIALLRAHVPIGIGVLLLTVLRLAWWLLADRRRPPHPLDQPRWQQLTARTVHLGLYLVVVLAGASGLGLVFLSGAALAIVAGTSLPDLADLPPRLVHGVAGRAMLALLALHVGAALYHQLILRDRLLTRMGLGR